MILRNKTWVFVEKPKEKDVIGLKMGLQGKVKFYRLFSKRSKFNGQTIYSTTKY